MNGPVRRASWAFQAKGEAPAVRASQIPMRVERLTDVPEERLEQLVASFRRDGAVEVRTLRQPNGSWTVEAAFQG